MMLHKGTFQSTTGGSHAFGAVRTLVNYSFNYLDLQTLSFILLAILNLEAKLNHLQRVLLHCWDGRFV